MDAPNNQPPTSYESSFLSQRRAVAADIDELGHVNNAIYVRWIQDAAVGHWSHAAPLTLQEQYVFVCLRHEIDYRAPLIEGDDVDIRTWLGTWSGPRFDRYVDIRKAGSAKWSSRSCTTWCQIDKSSGKPKRVGSDVLGAFGLSAD